MLGAARDLLRPSASKRWWRALPGYNSKQQRGNADLTYGVMVIDMGVHELSGMDTPICLTQVRGGVCMGEGGVCMPVEQGPEGAGRLRQAVPCLTWWLANSCQECMLC
jgi:hypothetical protein